MPIILFGLALNQSLAFLFSKYINQYMADMEVPELFLEVLNLPALMGESNQEIKLCIN